jgi:hypothetical protein
MWSLGEYKRDFFAVGLIGVIMFCADCNDGCGLAGGRAVFRAVRFRA